MRSGSRCTPSSRRLERRAGRESGVIPASLATAEAASLGRGHSPTHRAGARHTQPNAMSQFLIRLDLDRHQVRLGHISFFGTGLLNCYFVFSAQHSNVSGQALSLSSSCSCESRRAFREYRVRSDRHGFPAGTESEARRGGGYDPSTSAVARRVSSSWARGSSGCRRRASR